MHTFLLTSVLLFVRVCGLTYSDRDMILRYHNDLRRTVGPDAANMRKIQWDYDLEEVAQRYSDQCDWGHNYNRVQEYNSLGHAVTSVGENIFSGSWWFYDIRDAMKIWWNEVHDLESYNTTNWWPAGGHYAQMVWADTDRIGCGRTVTTTPNLCAGNGFYLVCNYLTAGNWLGLAPYEQGQPCSGCPHEFEYCDNKLCSTSPVIDGESVLSPASPPSSSTDESSSLEYLTASPTQVRSQIGDDISGACRSDQYECQTTKECIPEHFLCDGEFCDCLDGSDEKICFDECIDDEFQCHNGQCIMQEYYCDGIDDCCDQSDEFEGCLLVAPDHGCTSSEYACSDGTCFDQEWVCDGSCDCPGDFGDETDCGECLADEVHCDNGQCVPVDWLCDGILDCCDFSDERGCPAYFSIDLQVSFSSAVEKCEHYGAKLAVIPDRNSLMAACEAVSGSDSMFFLIDAMRISSGTWSTTNSPTEILDLHGMWDSDAGEPQDLSSQDYVGLGKEDCLLHDLVDRVGLKGFPSVGALCQDDPGQPQADQNIWRGQISEPEVESDNNPELAPEYLVNTGDEVAFLQGCQSELGRYDGNTIHQIEDVSTESCCGLCIDNSNCVKWGYNKISRHCLLFDHSARLRSSESDNWIINTYVI